MDNQKKKLKDTLLELGHYTMHRSMGRYFQFARKHSLSFSQMLILSRLHKDSEASVSEISTMLDISNSAVSQLLDKMVQTGLIERKEDPEDRRKKFHSLSPEGEKIIEQSINARSSWTADLIDRFTEEEAAEILPALNKFVNRIMELEPLHHHHQHKDHCRRKENV